MVVKMWSILEYDQEVEEKKLRKAEYEAGLEAGLELVLQSIRKSGYSLEEIAGMTGRTVEEVKRILKVD